MVKKRKLMKIMLNSACNIRLHNSKQVRKANMNLFNSVINRQILLKILINLLIAFIKYSNAEVKMHKIKINFINETINNKTLECKIQTRKQRLTS